MFFQAASIEVSPPPGFRSGQCLVAMAFKTCQESIQLVLD
jgi:hypothetical protein